MKKYFKVGQTVYDVRFGQGVVIEIFEDNRAYPVVASFINTDGYEYEYTLEGRAVVVDKHPSLYQNPIVTIPNDPFEEFEKGELVWVTHDTKIWEIRFYSHFEDGEHHCFKAQQIEGLTNVWKHVRKFEDNPLTK